MRDERVGPISVADAFWPSVFKSGHASQYGPKHRWTGGEATVDIAPYRLLDRLVDEGKTGRALGRALKEAVESIRNLPRRDRVISYLETGFCA